MNFINDLNYVKVEEAGFTVPEWQKKKVRKRLKKLKKNPTQLVSQKDAAKYMKSLMR